MDAAAKALERGTELDGGSIVVGDKIGQGGFGITYLAHDRKKNMEIVLKEFYPDHMVVRQTDHSLRVSPEYRESYDKSLRGFIREAKVLNELKRHPNIVRVYFFLEENNTAYYGMERLRGKDLRSYASELRKKTGKGMDAATAFQILRPVMHALEYCHAHKVFHRDVSPDNIFMAEVTDENGRTQIMPKLIDFGAAYVAIEEFTHTFPNVRKNGYSPIEQTMPAPYQGTWCDVYALSATFYMLLVGKPPIPAIDRANSEKLISPLESGAEISPAANAVLMEGLAFKAADRIQTISEFERRMGHAVGAISEHDEEKRESTCSEQAVSTSYPSIPTKTGVSVGKRAAAHGVDLLMALAAAVLLQVGLTQALHQPLGVGGYVLFVLLWMFLLMFGAGMLMGRATPGMRLLGVRLCAGRKDATADKRLIFHLIRSIPVVGMAAELGLLCDGASGLAMEEAAADRAISEVSQSVSVTNESCSAVTGESRSAATNSAGAPEMFALECVSGEYKGRMFPLRNGLLVGRGAKEPDLKLPRQDTSASGKHCVFHCQSGRWTLEDCSTNGTLVNGRKISHAHSGELKPGTKIGIGKQQFIFVKK